MRSLLIVEDSEEFRRLMINLLQGYYDKIYECSDGKDACEVYAKYHPDWVLMDIEMKEIDGLTATKKIKAEYPQAHVIVMTQYKDPEIRREAKLAGADKFVLKENIFEIKKIIETTSKLSKKENR